MTRHILFKSFSSTNYIRFRSWRAYVRPQVSSGPQTKKCFRNVSLNFNLNLRHKFILKDKLVSVEDTKVNCKR